jgi:hypothetical protein
VGKRREFYLRNFFKKKPIWCTELLDTLGLLGDPGLGNFAMTLGFEKS